MKAPPISLKIKGSLTLRISLKKCEGVEKSLARNVICEFYLLRKRGHSLVVKRYPSKLDMRVRFPLPAPTFATDPPQ